MALIYILFNSCSVTCYKQHRGKTYHLSVTIDSITPCYYTSNSSTVSIGNLVYHVTMFWAVWNTHASVCKRPVLYEITCNMLSWMVVLTKLLYKSCEQRCNRCSSFVIKFIAGTATCVDTVAMYARIQNLNWFVFVLITRWTLSVYLCWEHVGCWFHRLKVKIPRCCV